MLREVDELNAKVEALVDMSKRQQGYQRTLDMDVSHFTNVEETSFRNEE